MHPRMHPFGECCKQAVRSLVSVPMSIPPSGGVVEEGVRHLFEHLELAGDVEDGSFQPEVYVGRLLIHIHML